MKIVENPDIKEPSFLMSFIGIAIALTIITTAFIYSIPWLITLFQAWIVIVFVLGIIPMKVDGKYLNNRLRWEQRWLYPPVSITTYYLFSSDIILSIMYFIGIAALSYKYDLAITKADRDYTEKVKRKNDLVGKMQEREFWHT